MQRAAERAVAERRVARVGGHEACQSFSRPRCCCCCCCCCVQTASSTLAEPWRTATASTAKGSPAEPHHRKDPSTSQPLLFVGSARAGGGAVARGGAPQSAAGERRAGHGGHGGEGGRGRGGKQRAHLNRAVSLPPAAATPLPPEDAYTDSEWPIRGEGAKSTY